MLHKQTKLFAALMFSAFALAACSKSEAPSAPAASSEPAAQATEMVYAVGTDASYAPFEYQNDKSEVVGLTVDLLNAAAEKGGFKVKFINTPWEGIFQTLEGGDRDLLASSITITEERKKTMDFSDPYFEARQLIAIGKDVDVKTFADIKDKKLKVAVQTGTTGDEVVQNLLGKTNENIKRFESMPLALKELENGGVDVAVGDNGVVQNYVKNNPANGLKTVEDTQSFAPEYYGFAVKKGNTELLNKINAGLKAIEADGSKQKIVEQYLAK